MKSVDDKKPEWYSASSELTLDDQEWIWKNVPHPEEDEIKLRALGANGNVSVSGSENGTYKPEVKSELNWYKSELIFQLKRCTSGTSPNEIASLLKQIFQPWPSKEKHWLWVAQTYTARTLNWVMSATAKEHLRGGIRKTPPAYFTYQLRFRKERKQFRSTNGTRKYQDL